MSNISISPTKNFGEIITEYNNLDKNSNNLYQSLCISYKNAIKKADQTFEKISPKKSIIKNKNQSNITPSFDIRPDLDSSSSLISNEKDQKISISDLDLSNDELNENNIKNSQIKSNKNNSTNISDFEEEFFELEEEDEEEEELIENNQKKKILSSFLLDDF